MLDTRGCGILLHITSLPSKYGIGDLGEATYKFIDFLCDSHQKYWQILPLSPVGLGASPYQGPSAFASNHLLIDIDGLVQEGLLLPQEALVCQLRSSDRVDYQQVQVNKEKLLKKAYFRFAKKPSGGAYLNFLHDNEDWLKDYAFFNSVKTFFKGACWNQWETSIAQRRKTTIEAYEELLSDEIGYNIFCQFIFWKQWTRLKEYANSKNIKIIGDLPLFVSYDSSDVWTHRELFLLDEKGKPKVVAGVPPDYFSEEGQLWGNPLYNWASMKDEGYQWWIKRLKKSMEMFHVLRIDHFRGLESYWEIPADATSAKEGQWIKGPGEELFKSIRKSLRHIPLIAEDLGIITEEVNQLRKKLSLPGMKVLQFAIEDGKEEEILPQKHPKDMVIYTGTHDNDTLLGWVKGQQGTDSIVLKNLQKYYGINDRMNDEEICWSLIEVVLSSNGFISIIPLQDMLCLDSSSRMNKPGTVGDNWQWRLREGVLTEEHGIKLKELTEKHKR